MLTDQFTGNYDSQLDLYPEKVSVAWKNVKAKPKNGRRICLNEILLVVTAITAITIAMQPQHSQKLTFLFCRRNKKGRKEEGKCEEAKRQKNK